MIGLQKQSRGPGAKTSAVRRVFSQRADWQAGAAGTATFNLTHTCFLIAAGSAVRPVLTSAEKRRDFVSLDLVLTRKLQKPDQLSGTSAPKL